MKLLNYDIDLDKAVEQIKKNNYKRIVLQIPEGLKPYVSKIIDYIQIDSKLDIFISADPCFGACDLFAYVTDDFNADLVIHIGHSPIPELNKDDRSVLFIDAFVDFNVDRLIEKSLKHIDCKKIGLISTAQHVHLLDKVKQGFEKKGINVLIGKGDNRLVYPGQILGCNFSSAKKIAGKVDEFLFIGSGTFHSLGLILSTNKKVISVNPYSFEIKIKELCEMKDLILKQRYGAIARSKEAKTFGILIGSKSGQKRYNLARSIQEKLKKADKKSYLFILNNFSAVNLEGFSFIDCLVSTACPRIAIDDYLQYKTAIITPVELDILLGLKKWDEYHFDEILAK